MLKGSIRCSENAERIWFDRDAKGLVYHSQNEEAGAKPTTSRIGTRWCLGFSEAVDPDSVRRRGKGWDKNGKPIIWEIWMPDTDTFHWRIMGNGRLTR
jgi:hypothetical protein